MKLTYSRIASAFDYLDSDALASAVCGQLGYEPANESHIWNDTGESELLDTLRDTHQYSAEMGISGFIYYRETCKFTNEYYQLIMTKIHQLEDETGAPICKPGEGYRDENETIRKNWMAWFALEYVAGEFMRHLE